MIRLSLAIAAFLLLAPLYLQAEESHSYPSTCFLQFSHTTLLSPQGFHELDQDTVSLGARFVGRSDYFYVESGLDCIDHALDSRQDGETVHISYWDSEESPQIVGASPWFYGWVLNSGEIRGQMTQFLE